KLADNSSKSVEQIRTLLNAIQADTLHSIESMEKVTTEATAGMNLVSKTGETFSTIANSTKNVAHEVQKIVSSINSMLTQSTQLRSSIENVAKQTEITEDN
ncbi:methyl-accepting chemotaxis protein, partial [Robertmurraya sp. DFI.2.37]|uniref:methyl-accepting chemotaxis protein n=1 Tax=Robertmurraya sp. DFI.2.37 TaxID=3031819 RepID=UPI0023DBCDAA